MMRKEDVICAFLLELREKHRQKEGGIRRPLIVGFQGPQGSGKSYTCTAVVRALARHDPPVRVVVLSLDDLYLPYAEMKTVGDAHFSNALLQGRGQPGTHDVERGVRILSALHENTFDVLSLPRYDKSARGGLGDRYADDVKIQWPLDIVLFEGWCLGFCALDAPTLDGLWGALHTDALAYVTHTREDIDAINDSLRCWGSAWYPYIDAFIQYMPSAAPGITPWSLVYPWRLEAEHEMMKQNGGRGMSDAQIQSFVARFLPTYEIFAVDMRERNPWSGKCLCFEVGPDRAAKAVYRA